MGGDFAQVAAGGVLALLIIREVLGFLTKRKNGKGAGELDPSYWQKDYRDAVREVNSETLGPRLERIERLLERMEK